MYHHFNIQQFCVLPTQYIYVFCVDLRTKSDFITTQNFVTETECVYCAVRTEPLSIIFASTCCGKL
jgi:hypothetical protein